MKTCLYLRVSTFEQTFTSQREAVGHWLRAQGIDPATCTEYADHGYSGKNQNRPGWLAMSKALDEGAHDTVVMYSLSRAGRRASQLHAWVEKMRDANIRLVFVKESFDLATPIGRLLFAVLAAVAEMEREQIRERQKDGIAAYKKSGKKWGFALTRGNVFTPEEAQSLRERTRKGETVYAVWRSLPQGRASYNTVKAACKSQ